MYLCVLCIVEYVRYRYFKITDPHSKCDRSVSDQGSLLPFFTKEIRSDESQDRFKANIEDNVSTKNDILAPVHNGYNFKDLQNVDNNK